MIQKLLLLGLLVFGISACANPQNNKKGNAEPKLPIKRINYYVRYLDINKEVQMEAKFYSDSSNFLIPEGVFVNEDKMQVKKLPKVGWQHKLIKKPAPFDSSYVFKFKHNASFEQIDSLEFKVLGNLKLATPKIKAKTGGLIQWEGPALDKEDALTLIIEDSEGNPFTINHVGLTRGAKFEIRPELIENIKAGTASLRIVYKRREQIQKEGMIIQKLMEYYFRPIKFELSE
jgi:hypothetical protein